MERLNNYNYIKCLYVVPEGTSFQEDYVQGLYINQYHYFPVVTVSNTLIDDLQFTLSLF